MDYEKLLAQASHTEVGDVVAFLSQELPYVWQEAYEQFTQRPINILKVRVDTFVYVYDFYSGLEAHGAGAQGLLIEDRLVGAFGTSSTPVESRDPGRMRGCVGPTEKRYGSDRDKGHVFGRLLGGGGDGPGINL
jgi:hypothetical protein